MKKLQLAIWYIGMFVLAVSAGTPVIADPIVSKPLPALKIVNVELYDATGQYQAKYGLSGRFIVKKAEIDSRVAAADGPAYYRMEAAITKPGTYTFTFENTDHFGYVFEMRKVRVAVDKGRAEIDESSQKVVVSPEDSVWKSYFRGLTRAHIGNQFLINWSYYPGGEGIPGGWSLSKVEDILTPMTTGPHSKKKNGK